MQPASRSLVCATMKSAFSAPSFTMKLPTVAASRPQKDGGKPIFALGA